MFTLLSNKTFLAGLAAGVVVGYMAHKYLNEAQSDNKAANISKDLIGLATKIGGAAVVGKACGMGFGAGLGRNR